jgi:hypothetical protein
MVICPDRCLNEQSIFFIVLRTKLYLANEDALEHLNWSERSVTCRFF